LFLNAIIPSITPIDGSMPGYSIMRIDSSARIMSLNHFFIQLEDSYTYSFEESL
jgi:hypothetical protein